VLKDNAIHISKQVSSKEHNVNEAIHSLRLMRLKAMALNEKKKLDREELLHNNPSRVQTSVALSGTISVEICAEDAYEFNSSTVAKTNKKKIVRPTSSKTERCVPCLFECPKSCFEWWDVVCAACSSPSSKPTTRASKKMNSRVFHRLARPKHAVSTDLEATSDKGKPIANKETSGTADTKKVMFV